MDTDKIKRTAKSGAVLFITLFGWMVVLLICSWLSK